MGHLGQRDSSEYVMAAQGMLFQEPVPSYLIPYGIQTEDSDYRIHVSFSTDSVFLFETGMGLEAVREYERKNIKPVYATNPAVKDGLYTARGFRVFWKHIKGCQQIVIPERIVSTHQCFRMDSTSVKGSAAAGVAMDLVRHGVVRLPMIATEVTDMDMQLNGRDMLVTRGASIQIKCDWFAGYIRADGTMQGLYLQTHERNPLKQF
jgi:hypothetical protein